MPNFLGGLIGMTNGLSAMKENYNSSKGDSQQDVENVYKKFIDLLQYCSEEIKGIQGVNSQIKILRSDLVDTLTECINNAKQEARLAMNTMMWDKLAIAFFGETNAGKSTIIETFRILFDDKRGKKNDGLIVGDGQSDFTKDYNEYNLSIDGHPFKLIDIPGIEGDENCFKGTIKDALRKAHCVFYVNRHDKKPDEGTAGKIKEYLGDWIKVYSIQNIRNDPSYYEEEKERETLLTPNILRGETVIKESFKNILGDVYRGNIALQALLAMCSKGDFSDSRPDFQTKQRKLLTFFGSADEILRFSQFQTIVNLVKEKSANFKQEIIESNKQKILSIVSFAIKRIESVIKSHEEDSERFNENLKGFRRKVNSEFENTKKSIDIKIRSEIDISFNNLNNSVFKIIDKKSKDALNQIDRKISQFKNELPKNLIKLIKNEIEGMSSKINAQKKGLEGFTFQTIIISDFNFTLDIDTKSVMDELKTNLDDIGDFATDVAGAVGVGAAVGRLIPVVGPAVGAGIGAGVGCIVGFISRRKKKSCTKNKMSKSLNEAKEKICNQIKRKCEEIKSELETKKQNLSKSIDTEINNFEDLGSSLDEVTQRIKLYGQKVKN